VYREALDAAKWLRSRTSRAVGAGELLACCKAATVPLVEHFEAVGNDSVYLKKVGEELLVLEHDDWASPRAITFASLDQRCGLGPFQWSNSTFFLLSLTSGLPFFSAVK